MVYPCLCFCHYASITHLCIFFVFFVKLPAWVWSEQCVHTTNTSSSAQGRCCRKVREALKVKFLDTVQQDHRRIQREVIQHNLLHPCVHFHRFLHRCVQSMNFSDHSRSVLFFFTASHLPLGLSASLRGYHVFFYIYYTALEYVCFIAHLSWYIT